MNYLLLGEMTSVLLFAQDAAQAAPAAAPADQPLMLTQFLPFLAIGVLFYFILIRPERRKAREHANELSQVKKNDKVVTVGGMYGTVFNVQREADRVTLKIDEGTNTKIDVTLGSIARILRDDAPGEKDSKGK